MTSLSDPSRASRRDRRKAQKAVDAAYAAGHLTAADRTLRTQRIEAAQTRGDLTMITRDVLGPAAAAAAGNMELPPPTPTAASQPGDPAPPTGGAPTPSLGSAIDPAVLESMTVRTSHRATTSSAATPAALARAVTVTGSLRKVVIAIVLVVAALIGLCVLGIVGTVVYSAISGVKEVQREIASSAPSNTVPTDSTTTSRAAGLHTAAGWRAFVAAVKAESGTTEVYDAVVYPEYAAVALVSGDGADRRVFRDGAFLGSFQVRTEAMGNRVDLAQIEPEVISRLPRMTADRLGVATATESYLIINALPSEPRILVYLQANGGSQYRSYALDGTPVQ